MISLVVRQHGKTRQVTLDAGEVQMVQTPGFLDCQNTELWRKLDTEGEDIPGALLAGPTNDGTILVDFDTRFIGELGEQPRVDRFPLIFLNLEALGNDRSLSSRLWRLEESFSAGGVRRVLMSSRDQQTFSTVAVESLGLHTVTDLAPFITAAFRSMMGIPDVVRDEEGNPVLVLPTMEGDIVSAFFFEPAGWTVAHFPVSGAGVFGFVEHGLERGFSIVPEDWASFGPDANQPTTSFMAHWARRERDTLDGELPKALGPARPSRTL
jgi:hypothetical protein